MTRKKKYKNGLSITPFIVNKDAGDVENGVDNFNSMMSTGNPTSGGMCESKTGDIVTDVREAGGKDMYIAKQELLLKNRKNKLGKTIDPAEKQNLKDEIDLIQAKINFVLSKPQQPKLIDEEIRRKRQELYKLKRQLLEDPPNQPCNWKPYAERRITKLRQELEDNGILESLKEPLHPVPKDFTFIQTPEFQKSFKKLGLDKDDLKELEDSLKSNPPQAPLGTNIYKFRWSPSKWNIGKRSGTRVIYGEYIIDSKVYLITIFKKNDKDSLTAEEENKIRKQFKSIEKK